MAGDDGDIAAIRRFSRFYTRQIGLLEEGLLRSPFSLTEARILYELAHREGLTAGELRRDLALDAGYLSRILKTFENKGLVARAPAAHDGRSSVLALTPAGRTAFAPLNEASQAAVAALIARLSRGERRRLTDAMHGIETLLGEAPDESLLLRPHRVGDIGWVTHRQAVLYAQEYGWDESFEALVAEIGAAFLKTADAARERAWIAELRGEIVGSVFLVRESDAIAKLRLLYVEPAARGLGIGRRLVAECIAFAREAGYRSIVLWTNDVLVSARRIYEAAGFELAAEERHRSFGHDLVGQNWQLTL
jgi:DNA-binding MarR family transcriptional regulator/N-acetylglutamate synthase-like GNAT family acetyltransferase